ALPGGRREARSGEHCPVLPRVLHRGRYAPRGGAGRPDGSAALRPARRLPRPRAVRRQAGRRDPAADCRAGPGKGAPGAGRAPRHPRSGPQGAGSNLAGAPQGAGSNLAGAGVSLRLALIGAGRMGAHHARVLSQSPGVALDVVIDRDAGRAELVASPGGARHGIDHDLALGCDAAIVATNAETHAEVAATLLAAGIPLLIE